MHPDAHGGAAGVSMEFDSRETFGVGSPEAYQRLLLDAMLGDATLFAREDEVVAAWDAGHADPGGVGARRRAGAVPGRQLGARGLRPADPRGPPAGMARAVARQAVHEDRPATTAGHGQPHSTRDLP
jgi:hypothetical protein